MRKENSIEWGLGVIWSLRSFGRARFQLLDFSNTECSSPLVGLVVLVPRGKEGEKERKKHVQD